MNENTLIVNTPSFDPEKYNSFRSKIEHLINCESMENGSDTPDWILAEYLTDCLKTFDKTISAREAFYGRVNSSDLINFDKVVIEENITTTSSIIPMNYEAFTGNAGIHHLISSGFIQNPDGM